MHAVNLAPRVGPANHHTCVTVMRLDGRARSRLVLQELTVGIRLGRSIVSSEGEAVLRLHSPSELSIRSVILVDLSRR